MSVEIFNSIIFVNNFQVSIRNNQDFINKKWFDEIKKIQTNYVFDVKYEENKTMILGYQSTNQLLIPLDIFKSNYVIVIPKNFNSYIDNCLVSLINYILDKIKLECSWDTCNEMNFRLTVYIPVTHSEYNALYNNPYFQIHQGTTRKTILGRLLSEEHYRYEFRFQVDNLYKIKPLRDDTVSMTT